MIMQADGNLVIKDGDAVIWTADQNLVVFATASLESFIDAFSPIRVYVTSINQLRIVLF